MGKWIEKEIKNVEKLEDDGLSYNVDDESGPCIGVEIDIKDDEVWGDYKDRVAKKLTEAGIKTSANQIKICYGSTYNG